jgi:hypothetical protein
MGFPWRKLATLGLGVGKVIGSAYVPGLGTAIEAVEATVPQIPGSSKKRQVELISDLSIDVAAALKRATPEQIAALKRARSEAIDAYVAARNAQEAAELAIQQAKDAYEAFDSLVDILKGQD